MKKIPLIVAALVVVAAGLVFVRYAKPEPTPFPNTPSPPAPLAITPTPLVTSNSSYRYVECSSGYYENRLYRLRLQCPSDWIVKESDYYSQIAFQPPAFRKGDYSPLFISFIDSKGAADLEDFYTNHVCDSAEACPAYSNLFGASATYKPVVVAGLRGIMFLRAGEAAPSTIIAFLHGPWLVKITKHDDVGPEFSEMVEAGFALISTTLRFSD